MEVARFELGLKVYNSFSLPQFKGSTFRGKFGHVLKRTICLQTHRDCERCDLRETCPYLYLFETKSRENQQVVRPFVIEPPLTERRYIPRDFLLYLHIILFGKAIDYFPYFLYSFRRMGEEGIGEDRGYYRIATVRVVDGDGKRTEIYDARQERLQTHFPRINLDDFTVSFIPQITLEFITPVRIYIKKQFQTELPFPVLLRAILRRYRSLQYFHGNGAVERYPINWEEAERVEVVHQELHFRRTQRYSNRQKAPLSISGMVGRITYRGNLGTFWPWIKMGEYLHIGKGTVFGLGGYRVVGR